MLSRWRDRWRRGRQDRAAASLDAWRETAAALLTACTEVLRATSVPPDIGVPLDRIDRLLMRFRSEGGPARSALRSDRDLAVRLGRMTDGLFELRNQTSAFLLRWQTAQQLATRGDPSIQAQRNLEEARLAASRTARRLTEAWNELAPEIERLLRVRPGGE